MSRCGDLHFKWNIGALDSALDLVHITLVTKKALKVLQKIIPQVFLLYKVSSSPLSNLQDLQMATWELLAPYKSGSGICANEQMVTWELLARQSHSHPGPRGKQGNSATLECHPWLFLHNKISSNNTFSKSIIPFLSFNSHHVDYKRLARILRTI